jgi:hypothetical protein
MLEEVSHQNFIATISYQEISRGGGTGASHPSKLFFGKELFFGELCGRVAPRTLGMAWRLL